MIVYVVCPWSRHSLVALECTLPMLRVARMVNTMYPYRSSNHGKPFDFL
jgi:hypothetical protein